MIFRAWDEPNRFTDIDAGITAADTDDGLTVVTWEDGDGWRWALTKEYPVMGADGTPDHWEDEEIDGGTAATEEVAEEVAEAAMEIYQRSLIRG